MKVILLGSLHRSSVLLGSIEWDTNSLLKWDSRLYHGDYEGCVALYWYRNLWAFRTNLLLPSSGFENKLHGTYAKGGSFSPYLKYGDSRLHRSDCNFVWDHVTSHPIIESYFKACRCLYPYSVPAGGWRKLGMAIWGTNPSLSVVDVLREGVF